MGLTNGFKFEDEPELTNGVYAKVIGFVIKNSKMSPADVGVFSCGLRAVIDIGIWKSKVHYDSGLDFSKMKSLEVSFPLPDLPVIIIDGVEVHPVKGIHGDAGLREFLDGVLAKAYELVKGSVEFSEFQDE